MSGDSGAPPVERPTILLVEDEPGVRRSIQLLLHAQGFDIRSFASSAALLADHALNEAICLVADYCMPEIDGLAVLRKLRERGWSRPAILITAYNSRDLLSQAEEVGFCAVIEKPLREHALADAIAQATRPPSGVPGASP